jgi:hypothetical protein
MPDLTPEMVRRCTAIDTFSERVPSSDGTQLYSVSAFKCDCLGFQHRGRCKHVKRVQEKVCTFGDLWWTGDVMSVCPRKGCGKPTDGDGKCMEHCPVCGADVQWYEVYV